MNSVKMNPDWIEIKLDFSFTYFAWIQIISQGNVVFGTFLVVRSFDMHFDAVVSNWFMVAKITLVFYFVIPFNTIISRREVPMNYVYCWLEAFWLIDSCNNWFPFTSTIKSLPSLVNSFIFWQFGFMFFF